MTTSTPSKHPDDPIAAFEQALDDHPGVIEPSAVPQLIALARWSRDCLRPSHPPIVSSRLWARSLSRVTGVFVAPEVAAAAAWLAGFEVDMRDDGSARLGILARDVRATKAGLIPAPVLPVGKVIYA